MGLFSRATTHERITAAAASVGEQLEHAAYLPVASPWAESTLARMVFEDIFGSEVSAPVTRAQAMSLPAVARARNLLVSTIKRFPLVELEGDAQTVDQPVWLQSTSGTTPPADRIGSTVDDLIFYGLSIWQRINDPSTGFPIAADRIPKHQWSIDGSGNVVVNGKVRQANEIILIVGAHEGILSYGQQAIADAKDLYKVVRSRLRNPAPALVLEQTEGDDMTDEQIDAMVARWSKARNDPASGGVGFTNKAVKARELGDSGDAQLMIEARNAASLDLARVVGVGASRIDATAPKASLNYETTQGRNLEFVDYDLQLYMQSIEDWLSMDSIVPSGRRVAFDRGDFTTQTPSSTGPTRED